MNNVTRRLLLSRAAAGLAALGLFDVAPRAAEAQLVWTTSEWKLADFQKLVNDPARIKQLYDVVQIGDGSTAPPICSITTTTSGRSTRSASG